MRAAGRVAPVRMGADCSTLRAGRQQEFLAARGRRAAAHDRGDARDGDERALFGSRHLRELRELRGVLLQVLEETLELALHGVHLLAHVEDDLHAREVHAEVARERQDDL